jgi:predicted HTH transcriptional regulator
VKNGPDKRRVQSPEELARLFQSGEKLYAESQVVAASTLEDFDHDRFIRFYEAKYSEKPPSRSEESEAYQTILENLELREEPTPKHLPTLSRFHFLCEIH